jgi:hypothetical protein
MIGGKYVNFHNLFGLARTWSPLKKEAAETHGRFKKSLMAILCPILHNFGGKQRIVAGLALLNFDLDY